SGHPLARLWGEAEEGRARRARAPARGRRIAAARPERGQGREHQRAERDDRDQKADRKAGIEHARKRVGGNEPGAAHGGYHVGDHLFRSLLSDWRIGAARNEVRISSNRMSATSISKRDQ